MKNIYIKYFILIFLSLVLYVWINSCGPVKEWPTEPGKVTTLGKGTKVRFVNLAFNSVPLDIHINNIKVYSNATFKLATYYFDLNPGNNIIQITRVGDTAPLVKDTVSLDSNKFYSIQIIGSDRQLSLKLFSIDKISPITNFSLIRLVNLFDEFDKIDLSVSNQVENFIISELEYLSITSFIRISPGSTKINTFETGKEKLIFTSVANFEANKIYSIYIFGRSGYSDSTGLNAYILDETKFTEQSLFYFEPGIAKVRFINGITLSPTAQIFVDNIQLRSSIPFNQATSFQSIRAGARRIKVNLGAGVGLVDTSLIFDEGEQYTVYLSNSANKLSVYNLLNEKRSVAGNRALIRVFNSSIDIENVVVNYQSLLGQSIREIPTYGRYTDYFEVAPGQITLKLSSSGKPNILSLSGFIEGGRIYTAFLTGSYTGIDRNALMLSFVKDNDTIGQNLFTLEQVKTGIRLINGSPEFKGLDFIIGTTQVASNLNYKFTTKYFQVATGFRNVSVKLSGSNNFIYQSSFNFEGDKKYLFFALDRLQSPDVIVLESAPRSIPFGRSSIRFVNGIWDQTAVDIKIINQAGTTNILRSTFKNVTNYFDVVGGENQIIITVAGTQVTLMTCEAQLEVGTTYTILLSGINNGLDDKRYSISFLKETADVYQKLTEFTPIRTKVRFLNGLFDNPTVDFYVDSIRYATSINYRLATTLLKIPSGNNKNLLVTPTGSLAQIYSRIANIDYQKEYTFVVCGERNFPDGFIFENPSKTVPVGKASIRFVHASSGLGNLSVNIQHSGGTSNIPNIAYKTASGYLDVNPGSNQITVTISSFIGNIILTSDANLDEGKAYTVYILGKHGNTGDSALDIYFLVESNPISQQLFRFAPLRSRLRFVNGSTDNPSLQLSVDNEFVATNVNYKFATSLLSVASGTNKRIKVFEFGVTNPLISQDFNLSHTKAYTLLVTNKKTNLEYVFFENPAKQVSPGKASVRIVHGAYDLSAVDITFNNYTSISKISSLNYKSVSSYVDLDAGFNEIIVTRTASPSQLILAIDATLEEGKLYTVFLLGNNSGNFGEEYSLSFLDETNSGGQALFTYTPSLIARMRVINASPNSTGLDVTLNQTRFVQNIVFGSSSGYQFLRSGLRDVRVFQTGITAQPLLNFSFRFETNRLYSLVLMDSVSKLTPILIEDLNFNLDPTKAYVRFINASSNSPPFDVRLGNPNGIVKHSYFTYQQITSYEPYEPQILSFVFTRTGTAEELISLRGLSLTTGKAYTIIVMGFHQGQIGQNLQVRWFMDN